MRFGYVLLGLVALTSFNISHGQCSNGLAGIQNGDVCCDVDCGTCGGRGCGGRPGGAEACCTSRIMDSGDLCSVTSAAPCIIDDEEEGPTCSNGLPGVEARDICCEAECGICGGPGCEDFPGGETACCRRIVREIGDMCSVTRAAPCVMDGEIPDEMCSDGTVGVQSGDICCEAQCGECGGSGCAQRPGGKDGCCAGRIEDAGMMCGNTTMAPCIIMADEDTPE